MRHACLIALVLLASIAATPRGPALDAPVRVAGGLVSGAPGRDASITVFKGVPFAAPPVGDLRWRAPRPVVAWSGVKKADQFGANCMQTIVDEKKPWTYEFMAHGPVSEDCLFLNVWTGAASAAGKRPVYVYVHGGANTEGSGAVPAYDGEGLARKGIVVVTVNYRLGVLGFFTHPELTQESEARASGNYALLDLIAALRWVREHIAAFGGDPGNVTLGGQSAGASNTHSLVASPLAKGLFHRAIAESGSSIAAGRNARTLADQERLGIEFAQAKGARAIAELRAMSWPDLTAPVPATSGAPAPAGGFRFGVVLDGHVLPASPLDAFTAGTQHDVPDPHGREPPRERRDAAPGHHGGRVPGPGAAALRRPRRRVPLALSGGDRRRGARLAERQRLGSGARVDASLGHAPRRDRAHPGLHLLLGSSAAGAGRRDVRRVPHLGGAVRDGRARDVDAPVHGRRPPHRRPALDATSRTS